VSGLPTVFDQFVASRGPALLRFAYLLTGDRRLAEDLVQDALVKAYRRWSRHPVEYAEAYVRRIIVNEYLSWRRLRSSSEVTGHIRPQVCHDAADAVAERDQVWRALADLPRRQRSVLVLRYYEDLSDADIAALLGCAEGTVRSLAARAFAALRRHPQLAVEPIRAPHREEA